MPLSSLRFMCMLYTTYAQCLRTILWSRCMTPVNMYVHSVNKLSTVSTAYTQVNVPMQPFLRGGGEGALRPIGNIVFSRLQHVHSGYNMCTLHTTCA